MKLGILYADKVTTVSETYAKEILTEEFGENMQHVLELRHHDSYVALSTVLTMMCGIAKQTNIW